MRRDDTLEKRILLIETNLELPRLNMLRNEQYKQLVKNGTYDVIARVYENKPGIILGKSQHISDVDIDACRTDSVDVSRRDSGGSAVYVDSQSGATLTYTLFARSKLFGEMTDRKKVYDSLVTPLVKHLGDDRFKVEGNFYVTAYSDGAFLPLIGHGFHETAGPNGVVQFDGLVHLMRPDVSKISEYLYLRDLYRANDLWYVKTRAGLYRVVAERENGWSSVDEVTGDAQLVLSEHKQLSQMKGLVDYNVSKNDFLEAFKQTLNEVFGAFVQKFSGSILDGNDIDISDHDLKLTDEGRSKVFNGHCFVFIPELQKVAKKK
jgi:hypothetical protein